MATDTIKPGGSIRRFAKAIEPWYNWGIIHVERMDCRGEGQVRFFELQWLGMYFEVQIGRAPKAVV